MAEKPLKTPDKIVKDSPLEVIVTNPDEVALLTEDGGMIIDFEEGAEDKISVTFSGNFRDLARAVAGVINSNERFVTMSDAINSVYFSYPGGTLSGTPTVSQT